MTIDADICKKIIELQAKQIHVKKQSVSFSQVVEEILREGLKNGKIHSKKTK